MCVCVCVGGGGGEEGGRGGLLKLQLKGKDISLQKKQKANYSAKHEEI